MNWRAFGTGAAIGAISASAIVIPTTLLLRSMGGASLVNFGPAIVGLVLLVVELALALIALVFACISLFRHRWRLAGFTLAASLLIAGWYGTRFLLG